MKEIILKIITGVFYTADAKPRPEFLGTDLSKKVALIDKGVESVMRAIKTPEDDPIIDAVIDQVRRDMECGDTTVFAEILSNVPKHILEASLPEKIDDLTVKINGKFIQHDHINHIELRSDLENDTTLENVTFIREGKTNSSPETWSIDNGDSQYHYDSEVEYEEDCKILGI